MSKTSKSTQENKPPSWAEGLFKTSASDAMKLYQSGAGGNTYLGNTVAPLSDTTMQGVNQLANAGNAWDTSATRDLYGQIGASSVGPSAASQYLTDTASGKYLENGNPYYRQRLDSEIADANSLIQSQFSGSGRYGSGANTGVVAKNTTNMLLQGLENDWNRERSNQMAAVGMLDQQRNAGLDRALNTTTAMSGIDQRNFENRLAGAGATLQAGQIMDQQSQAQLQDEIAKFYALDNQDWTRLGMLQSAAAGAAGNYGTQVATQRQPINAAGAIAPLFSGKSDVRLKDNIIRIGRMNGLNVYRFCYRDRPGTYVGVMAQELPMAACAVRQEPDGYLSVDYARLGFPMLQVA